MNIAKENKNQLIKIPKFLEEKIEEIRLNNISGSSELAKQSAELLIFLIENISVDSSSDLLDSRQNLFCPLRSENRSDRKPTEKRAIPSDRAGA